MADTTDTNTAASTDPIVPVTAAAPEPVAAQPASPAPPEDEFKVWVRANARWLMAELDWTRAGRTAEERETLNP